MKDYILVGKSDTGFEAQLLLKYANRHGLITGATGTGKTVTLQTLAEGFSDAGVPVFMADVKGDLQRLHQSGDMGKNKDIFISVAQRLGLTDFTFKGYPVRYWDCFGQNGINIRATISEIGPILLSRMLQLNDVQEGILNIVFRIADEEKMMLIDLKDLRAMLAYVSENATEISQQYGNIAPQSVATIQRSLLTLENQGATHFFGEPALNLNDLMKTTYDNRGYINILSAVTLMNAPDLYSSFLLWLLSELYENLPEVGDCDKPKFVFFFDEAHLLFNNSPQSLIEQIERVVRLIRSKGVGVYFITQNPIDVPDTILGQLSNRVQHALRAYSPRDQKSVQVAAETFRQNPNIDTAETITNLAVGQALVSFPDSGGVPTPVEIVRIIPPSAAQGALNQADLTAYIQRDDYYNVYAQINDRESAYEILHGQAVQIEQQAQEQAQAEQQEQTTQNTGGGFFATLFGGGTSKRQSVGEAVVKSVARNIAGQVGRQVGNAIIRGILGSLTRK